MPQCGDSKAQLTTGTGALQSLEALAGIEPQRVLPKFAVLSPSMDDLVDFEGAEGEEEVDYDFNLEDELEDGKTLVCVCQLPQSQKF